MRAPAAVLLLASAVAQAAGPRSTSTRSSANGAYAIRLEQLDEERCRIEVVKEREVAWELEKCLGTVDDLLFINNEGTRFWVLHVLPRIPPPAKRTRGSKGRPKMDPVFEAVVATLHDREGRVLASKKLKDLLEYKRRGLLRKLEKHFKWLEGVLDVPGKAPRVSDTEMLEFEVVSGKTSSLKF